MNYFDTLMHSSKTIIAFIQALKEANIQSVIVVPIRYTYNTEKIEIRKRIGLVFYSPNNYTMVGTIIPDDKGRIWPYIGNLVEVKSNHDSGWRDATESLLKSLFRDIKKDENYIEAEEYSLYLDFDISGIAIIEETELQYIDRDYKTAKIIKK